MELKDILAKCDHTLLRTDCTAREIRELTYTYGRCGSPEVE